MLLTNALLKPSFFIRALNRYYITDAIFAFVIPAISNRDKCTKRVRGTALKPDLRFKHVCVYYIDSDLMK